MTIIYQLLFVVAEMFSFSIDLIFLIYKTEGVKYFKSHGVVKLQEFWNINWAQGWGVWSKGGGRDGREIQRRDENTKERKRDLTGETVRFIPASCCVLSFSQNV